MKELNILLQAQFDKMCATGKLFKSHIPGDRLWTIYLGSFQEDPIFRDPNSTSHTCNLCNNFIRRYGNIVAIDKNNKLMTIFDVQANGEFNVVMSTMAEAIRAFNIGSVFFETSEMLRVLSYEPQTPNREVFKLGIAKNVKRYTQAEVDLYPGTVKVNEVVTFNHMHLSVPKQFVDASGKSIESINSEYISSKEVFMRGLTEIPLDTLELVRDLIIQESLLNGQAHLSKVESFIKMKREFATINANDIDNWCWVKSYGYPFAKFRNELIGTLCVELAEGVDLNTACKTWNQRVDPVNYMKVKSPITQRQIEEAKKFVIDEGYLESFDRKLATMDDIAIEEILHANVGDGKIKEVTIFDTVKASVSTRHKRSEFDGVEEVTIDKFMSTILPTCTAVELFLDNKHKGQMVNLTTTINRESKPIFKWDNNFSYTFNGNLAGQSQIKEAVKLAGGAIDGVLNFRLAWNDGDGRDNSDLDAWASEPDGRRIGFSTEFRKGRNPGRSPMSGQLDVDKTSPNGQLAVENITWNNLSKMKDGVYTLWVNQYSNRNSQGFKAEIEFGDEIYSYSYDRSVSGNINVARVTLKGGEFSVEHLLPVSSGSTSSDLYNLPTNEFHKVNLVCLSPNHWRDNKVGNKHYLFMLDKCYTEDKIRTFHNENLLPELVEKHRKVMDVLGDTTRVEGTKKQLAGVGFNATIRDSVILKLSGTHKRVVKITF